MAQLNLKIIDLQKIGPFSSIFVQNDFPDIYITLLLKLDLKRHSNVSYGGENSFRFFVVKTSERERERENLDLFMTSLFYDGYNVRKCDKNLLCRDRNIGS